MEIIRDKHYYDQVHVEAKKAKKKVQGYITLANFYKKLYFKVYGRKDIVSRRIAAFCRKRNQKCVELGTAIAMEQLRWMFGELVYLDQYSKKEKP